MRPDLPFRQLLFSALLTAGCTGSATKDAALEEPPTSPEPVAPPSTEPIQTGPIQVGALEPVTGGDCVDDVYVGPGADLSPVQSVDAIRIRSNNTSRMEGAAEQSVVRTVGTLCMHASFMEGCEDQLDVAWPDSGSAVKTTCGQIGCTFYDLQWSMAGTVGVVSTPQDLLAFLGPLDTAGEVQAVLWSKGYDPVCSATTTRQDDGSWLTSGDLHSDCPISTTRWAVRVSGAGAIEQLSSEVISSSGACVGRLTDGHTVGDCDDQLGSRLARDAHLEAVAAIAFRRLERELGAHGAPVDLLDGARRAAHDEDRHAEIIGALARKHGATPATPIERPTTPRSLEEIALENAVEGCAREALGAAIGFWQAEHAHDPEIREAMTAIAPDELRHAEWSRALDRWLQPQLSSASRRRIARARRRAWKQLGNGPSTPAASLRRTLGLPNRATISALVVAIAA